MCYYTEQRETTASVVVPLPGLQQVQPAELLKQIFNKQSSAGQSKTKSSDVVRPPGLQPALQPAHQPAHQTGHNSLSSKPTVLLHTNAMHKRRGNLNFNL